MDDIRLKHVKERIADVRSQIEHLAYKQKFESQPQELDWLEYLEQSAREELAKLEEELKRYGLFYEQKHCAIIMLDYDGPVDYVVIKYRGVTYKRRVSRNKYRVALLRACRQIMREHKLNDLPTSVVVGTATKLLTVPKRGEKNGKTETRNAHEACAKKQ